MKVMTSLKAYAKEFGRAPDTVLMPLSHLTVEPGFNARKVFDPAKLDELAKSIANVGFYKHEPIIVRLKDEQWVIRDGERRYRAAQIAIEKYGAELEAVPVVIAEKGTNEADDLVLMVNKNNGGVPLSGVELADIVVRLRGFNWSYQKIAEKIGYHENQVRNLEKLKEADEDILEAVVGGVLPANMARATVSMTSQEKEQVRKVIKEAKATGKKVTKTKVEKATKGKVSTIKTKEVEDLLAKLEAKLEGQPKNTTVIHQIEGIRMVLDLAAK